MVLVLIPPLSLGRLLFVWVFVGALSVGVFVVNSVIMTVDPASFVVVCRISDVCSVCEVVVGGGVDVGDVLVVEVVVVDVSDVVDVVDVVDVSVSDVVVVVVVEVLVVDVVVSVFGSGVVVVVVSGVGRSCLAAICPLAIIISPPFPR
jgi:hypothetical protein